MNYDLAKELKDAGFPQEGKGKRLPPPVPERKSERAHNAVGVELDAVDLPVMSYDLREMVYSPTLEELIEACGEKLTTIQNMLNKGWIAFGLVNGRRANNSPFSKEISEKGPTPTEAVARLWLALNAKLTA